MRQELQYLDRWKSPKNNCSSTNDYEFDVKIFNNSSFDGDILTMITVHLVASVSMKVSLKITDADCVVAIIAFRSLQVIDRLSILLEHLQVKWLVLHTNCNQSGQNNPFPLAFEVTRCHKIVETCIRHKLTGIFVKDFGFVWWIEFLFLSVRGNKIFLKTNTDLK